MISIIIFLCITLVHKSQTANFKDTSVPLFFRIVDSPNIPENLPSNHHRFQRLIEHAGFPCEPQGNYSYSSVRTVHQVRPQDIGIIGALGDSLTAGTGAKAKNILEVLDENRGVSFTTGGEGDWKSSPTLANFIRVFNPNLKGASYGNTRAVMIPFKESAGGIKGLNLSKSGSQAKDLPEMARHLVHMVQRIPNWENEWKLFTILIGHNDLCSSSCENNFNKIGLLPRRDTSPYAYRKHLEEALDILRVNLPRTIILLMGIADVTMILDLKDRPLECGVANYYECPCLFENSYSGERRRVRGLVHSYRDQVKSISRMSKFNTDQFTVEYVPAVQGRLPPSMESGRLTLDLGLLAPDCFHFMSNLHGIVARNLWNNLMEPSWNKSVNYHIKSKLVCPSPSRPFIATKHNS